jgi:uncharacterized protein YuzE
MNDYPRVVEERTISIEFAPGMNSSDDQPLDVVLDFNENGVVGIEVISIQFQAGMNALEIIRNVVPTDGDGPLYAYDKTCDCLYIRLRPGRSRDQRALSASMFLDAAGRILALRAAWPA